MLFLSHSPTQLQSLYMILQNLYWNHSTGPLNVNWRGIVLYALPKFKWSQCNLCQMLKKFFIMFMWQASKIGHATKDIENKTSKSWFLTWVTRLMSISVLLRWGSCLETRRFFVASNVFLIVKIIFSNGSCFPFNADNSAFNPKTRTVYENFVL